MPPSSIARKLVSARKLTCGAQKPPVHGPVLQSWPHHPQLLGSASKLASQVARPSRPASASAVDLPAAPPLSPVTRAPSPPSGEPRPLSADNASVHLPPAPPTPQPLCRP